jgi:hypothetical protein
MEHPKQGRRLTILVDEHLRGQAILLHGALAAQGWLELLGLHLATFEEVGLSDRLNQCAFRAIMLKVGIWNLGG